MNVLTDKICRLELYSIDMQALTGYRLSKTQVISDYTYALDTLDRYDYQLLAIEETTEKSAFRATYESAMDAIDALRTKFGSGDLFGNEKDQSFDSSINTIYQTFDGKELYTSIEEKAAMLLYLYNLQKIFTQINVIKY